MNFSLFPQGGRDPLIVVVCHSSSFHSQGKEGGVIVKMFNVTHFAVFI